jgi:hypothetical protein
LITPSEIIFWLKLFWLQKEIVPLLHKMAFQALFNSSISKSENGAVVFFRLYYATMGATQPVYSAGLAFYLTMDICLQLWWSISQLVDIPIDAA